MVPGACRRRVDTTFGSLFDGRRNTSCERRPSVHWPGTRRVRRRGADPPPGTVRAADPMARRRRTDRAIMASGGNRLHSTRYDGTPAAAREMHSDRHTGSVRPAMPSSLAGIARFPRARLGHAPTPIDPAPNLGAALGVDLRIKRDDCTGPRLRRQQGAPAPSSTSARPAARGADTVLVTGPVQSNLVRIAAAAARKLGMAVHIQLEDRVADGGETYRTSGNLLLDRVAGRNPAPLPRGRGRGGGGRGGWSGARRRSRPRAEGPTSSTPPPGTRRSAGSAMSPPPKRSWSRPRAPASMPWSAPRGARSPMPGLLVGLRGARRASAGPRHLRAPRCREPGRAGGVGGGSAPRR